MDNYDFTDTTDGTKTKVEYTFGYKVCEDNKVRIFLHHENSDNWKMIRNI